MNKKKTIAYMMAATLLVGGTFVGTKAWFSDKVDTDNGIKITMGTLDLELKENGAEGENQNKGWKLIRDEQVISEALGTKKESNENSKNGDIKKEHVNIRPGDYFEREFTVTNKGSLDQIVKIDSKLVHGAYNHFFELTIQEGNDILLETNEFRLNPNQSKTVKLKLQPHEEALDNTQQGKTFDFEALFSDITLTGRQVNADNTQLSPEHK